MEKILKKKEPKKLVNFRFDTETKKQLEKVADYEKMTLTDVVIQSLQHTFKQYEGVI